MADTIASLTAVIGADVSGFQKGLSTAKSGLGDFAGSIAKVGLGAVVGLTAALAGIGIASIKSAADAELGLAGLRAVIKSTGGVAGVTEQAALDLAAALQKTTRFSDDEIVNAEKILLTFDKIGKKTFPKATEAVLNLSTAFDMTTDSAAMMIGKALQSEDGFTALRRSGVSFTDSQERMIRNFFRTGQAAKAADIIIGELNKEVGGAAVAAGATFAGRMDQLKNSLDDVFETIGGLLLPGLTALTKGFGDLARGAAEGLQSFISAVSTEGIGTALSDLIHSISIDAANLGLKILAALGVSPEAATEITAQFLDFMDGIRAAIKTSLDTLFPKEQAPMSGFEQNLFGKDKEPAPFIDRLKAALGITPDVETQISNTIGGIQAAIAPIFKQISDGIAGFMANIEGANFEGVGRIFAIIAGGISAITVIGGLGIIQGLAAALPLVGTAIKDFANAATALTSGDVSGGLAGLVKFFGDLNSALKAEGVGIIEGVVNGIRGLFGLKGDFKLLNELNRILAFWSKLILEALDNLERLKTALGIHGEEFSKVPKAPGSSGAGDGGASFNAGGGFLQAGRLSVVGERGPELFRPSVDGRIIPNRELGGGGGNQVVFNIQVTGVSSAAQFFDVILGEAKRRGQSWA